MPSTPKKKQNTKTTLTRVIALVLAVLLLGSVLVAAVLANVY